MRASAKISSSRQPARVTSEAANRPRSPTRLIALSALIALSLGYTRANGEVFKCVDAAGKTSYQADPCPTVAEDPAKVQPPAPQSTPPRQPSATPALPSTASRQSSTAPAASPTATNPKAVTGVSRGPKDRIPTEADFRGPREAWERLGLAIRRGDKDAALKELTPAAKQRLAPIFETIGSKSTPLNVEELGSIRSVTLAGEGLATITLTRKKADGIYGYEVNLIRDADGRWRIDNM
jgi:uncharacterized protein DUF4124